MRFDASRKIIQNPSSSGFSLAEVMIALAIGSIGMMGFMKMYDNQLKAGKRQLAQQDVISLMTQIQTSVMTPKGCMANFAFPEDPLVAAPKVPIHGIFIGNLANGSRVSPIVQFTQQSTVSPQGPHHPIGTFGSIQIMEAYLEVPGFQPGVGTYQGNLIIRVEQAGQQGSFYGTREMKTSPIPVLIYTDDKDKIIACNELVAPTIISASPGPSPGVVPYKPNSPAKSAPLGNPPIHDARVPVQTDLSESAISEAVNSLFQNVVPKGNEPAKVNRETYRSIVPPGEPAPTGTKKIYTCICKTNSDVSCQSNQSEVMQSGQATCLGPPGMAGAGQSCSWVCY